MLLSYASGVNFALRKIATTISATIQLVKEGENTYSFNTLTTFRSQHMKFTLNEEFEEEMLDGRKIKCTVWFEGNKMIHQQKGDKAVRFERVFTDDEMISTSTINDIVSTRWYKAVE